MLALLVTLLVLGPRLAAAAITPCPCRADYAAFCARFDRPRAKSTAEYYLRCNTFCNNQRAVRAHNAMAASYTAELKPLHDLPDRERRARLRFGYRGPRDKANDTFASASTLPPLDGQVRTRNWFMQSRVTDIRDQGQCGSCWAESATGVLESAYAQQHRALTQLSVQQAAECTDGVEHNAGCEGGWPIDVFKYVQRSSGGLCAERDYPTTIGNGADVPCNTTLAARCTRNIPIKQILSVPTGNEHVLMQALQLDVVSVAIDASGMGFYSYSSGIYDGTFRGSPDCAVTSLDHAVIAIGYGVSVRNSTPFYVVRNSWGATAWGKLNGYILFKRGDNTCGIAQDATFLKI